MNHGTGEGSARKYGTASEWAGAIRNVSFRERVEFERHRRPWVLMDVLHGSKFQYLSKYNLYLHAVVPLCRLEQNA
jgi:hypothetical protein